jgi:hypothetical protein
VANKTVRLNEDGSLRAGTLEEIANSPQLKNSYETLDGSESKLVTATGRAIAYSLVFGG